MSVKVTIEWEDGVVETYGARGIRCKEERQAVEMRSMTGVAKSRIETRAEIAFIVQSHTKRAKGDLTPVAGVYKVKLPSGQAAWVGLPDIPKEEA